MSRRSSTSTPAEGSSRNRIFGSCTSALAIITRRFMPPDSVMIFVLRLSHSDSRRSTCSTSAGSGAQPNSPRLKLTAASHGLEGLGGQFLRHEADQLARGARFALHVVAAGQHACRVVAFTRPQTMPISVVLPAPLGPSSAKISPCWISRFTALQRR